MYIKADDVCVTFPVFDAHQRSFKKTVFKAAAGGGLSSFRKGFAEIEALKHITLDIREGEAKQRCCVFSPGFMRRRVARSPLRAA